MFIVPFVASCSVRSKALVPSSFLLLLVRHLLLEAMHLFLIANLAPFVVRPGAPFVASFFVPFESRCPKCSVRSVL